MKSEPLRGGASVGLLSKLSRVILMYKQAWPLSLIRGAQQGELTSNDSYQLLPGVGGVETSGSGEGGDLWEHLSDEEAGMQAKG